MKARRLRADKSTEAEDNSFLILLDCAEAGQENDDDRNDKWVHSTGSIALPYLPVKVYEKLIFVVECFS